MDLSTALGLIKTRMNRLAADTSMDLYYERRAQAAEQELERSGIHLLTDSADDLMLLVDLTVWQIQNRDKPGGSPDWLRMRIRNRWLQEQRGQGT